MSHSSQRPPEEQGLLVGQLPLCDLRVTSRKGLGRAAPDSASHWLYDPGKVPLNVSFFTCKVGDLDQVDC